MIVDAHQHIWDLRSADYAWLQDAPEELHRSFSMEEVRPLMEACEVGLTVLVQAADNDADTANMTRAAQSAPEVAAIVAWAPLDDPDETSRFLNPDTRHPLIKGVRSLTHIREDPDWIISAEVSDGLRILEQLDLSLDYVTATPAALDHLPLLVRRHPKLRVVLDHLGSPPMAGSPSELMAWRKALKIAGENSLLYAKLSGLYLDRSQLSDPRVPAERLRRVLEIALDTFGPERLMWGSDWPICQSPVGYINYWEAISALIDELMPEHRDRLLGANALDFYRIPDALA